MFLKQCPFCENVNPTNSKFCNACGVRLHAALCPHCGAVNVVTARSCVNCRADLLETLRTALCPQCGAVNDAASTSCVDCAAPLQPAMAPKASARPATPEHADRTETLAEAQHETPESARAYSIHFARDDSVQIDYHSEPVHARSQPAAEALATRARTIDLGAHAPTAETRTAVARFAADSQLRISAPPFSESSRASVVPPPIQPRRLSAGVVATSVLALFATSTYFVYREHARASIAALISAGGAAGAQAHGTGSDAGSASDAGAGLIGTAPARAAADDGRPPSERQDDRFGPCTDAVAALGLCTPGPTQRRQ